MSETRELEALLISKDLYDRLRALWHARVAASSLPTLELPVLREMSDDAIRAYLEREEGKA